MVEDVDGVKEEEGWKIRRSGNEEGVKREERVEKDRLVDSD